MAKSSLVNNAIYTANEPALIAVYVNGGNYAPCPHSGLTLTHCIDASTVLAGCYFMPVWLDGEAEAEYITRNQVAVVAAYDLAIAGTTPAIVLNEEVELNTCKKMAGWPADAVA